MSKCEIDSHGNKECYLNGEYHREDGTAVEYVGGSKYWFINGKHHREDGPAIEWADGTKYWYLNDKRINCSSNEEFLKLVKMRAFW